MKIGIDGRASKWYRGTGIGTYTYQLINNLSKIDSINNYIFFMSEYPNNMTLGKNISLVDISKGVNNGFWDDINLPNALNDKDIDLYHVPQNGVGLSMNNKYSSVITLHDVIPYRMPETVSERYLKIFSESIPNIVNGTNGIITVSNYSKNDILKTFDFPEEKIFVTPLASEPIYKPLDKLICKNIVKKKYSISEDYILYVGGFSPRKNIPGLIKAFSKLSYKNKHCIKLVIAGTKGQSYDNYQKLTEKLGISNKVVFPGFIPTIDLPFLYNAANLFVYPSFYEGFGLPPLEAMSCGIPIISSNLTSIPEVVGSSGILVDPHNIGEIATAMNNVLLDKELSDKLSASGIRRASEFSWRKTAFETISSYNKIISDVYGSR